MATEAKIACWKTHLFSIKHIYIVSNSKGAHPMLWAPLQQQKLQCHWY